MLDIAQPHSEESWPESNICSWEQIQIGGPGLGHDFSNFHHIASGKETDRLSEVVYQQYAGCCYQQNPTITVFFPRVSIWRPEWVFCAIHFGELALVQRLPTHMIESKTIGPNESKSYASSLAQTVFGRILLHVACACRDHKFRWHWLGIRRELAK